MSWMGGKKALRQDIVTRFPLYYERYIEVFGGGGWVLFYKQPEKFEVYNDFNDYLVNLYRCVRQKPEELIRSLEFVLNARSDFFMYRTFVEEKPVATLDGDIALASAFYCLIRYSYASGLVSYASQPHDMWKNFPKIREAHTRIRGTIIENKDCVDLIKQYDREHSFFYLDPPYYDAEAVYLNIDGFVDKDHIRLRDALLSIDGKFILSYNDHERIRELYDCAGIWVEEIERLDNIKQRYDKGAKYKELLISNYDTSERSRRIPEQMSIFIG